MSKYGSAVTVYISNDERTELKKRAEKLGISIPQLMRRLTRLQLGFSPIEEG